jgi:hypothetical protein
MKSLNTLIVSSLALGSLSLTQAANVATTSLAAPALKITQTDGSNLAQGSIVRVGYFDLTGVGGDTTILKVGLYPELEAIFKAVGENGAITTDGDTGPVLVNAAGGFIGSIQNIDNGFMPAGRELYLWVFNTPPAADPTPGVPKPTYAAATDWAILRDPSWVMPSGALGSINLQTGQIDQAAEVFRGTLDTANSRILVGPAVIPEPACALLGLVALGLGLRRRRA